MGGRRDEFVGRRRSDVRRLTHDRSAGREHQPTPQDIKDPGPTPKLDLQTGTEQPPLHGAGHRHQVEDGHDRGSTATEPGRLTKALPGLRVIESWNVQNMGHLLGLPLVDRV